MGPALCLDRCDYRLSCPDQHQGHLTFRDQPMATIRQHAILVVATCGAPGVCAGSAWARVGEAGQTISKSDARATVHLRPVASSKSPFRKVPRHPLKRGRRLGAVVGSMVFCRAVGITETADPTFRNGL